MAKSATALPTGPLKTIVVDLSDPQVHQFAHNLLTSLVEMHKDDDGKVLALAAHVFAEACVAVLHMDCPLPEGNIQGIRDLLLGVQNIVLSHEDCARHMPSSKAKGMVH